MRGFVQPGPTEEALAADPVSDLSGTRPSFLSASAGHFGGQVVGRALDLLTVILTTRAFGAAGLGVVALALSVRGIGATIATLGLATALLRLVPRLDARARAAMLATSSAWVLGASVLIAGILAFAIPAIDSFFGTNGMLSGVLPAVLLAIPLLALGRMLVSFARGAGFLSPLILSLVLPPLTLFAGTAALVLTGRPFRWIGWTFFAASVVAFAVGAIGVRRITKRPVVPASEPSGSAAVLSARDILWVSMPMLGIAMVNQVSNWTDSLMLGRLADADVLGRYTAAARVPLILGMLLSSLNAVFAPVISSLYHKAEMGRLADLYSRLVHTLLLLVIPLVAFMLVAARPILEAFGPEFGASASVLRLVAIAQLVNVGVGPVGLLLNMSAHQWALLWAVIGATVFNVAANLVLIPLYGATGAAIASGTAVILSNLVRLYLVRRLLGVSLWQGARSGLLALVGCVPLICGGLVVDSVQGPWWAQVIAAFAATALSFVLAIVLVGRWLPRFVGFRERVAA